MDPLEKSVKAYGKAKHLDEKIEAAESIAREMWPKLHRYLRASCPSHAVEDVLMITLRAILEGLMTGKSIERVQPWCFQIARHKLSDYLERERRHKSEPMTSEELWRLIDASARTTPLGAAERMMLEEALDMVGNTRSPCREHLVKRYIYGMSFEEIGDGVGLTPNAARMAVNRCLELAQSLVAEKGVVHA